jgi:hypothetical protein
MGVLRPDFGRPAEELAGSLLAGCPKSIICLGQKEQKESIDCGSSSRLARRIKALTLRQL